MIKLVIVVAAMAALTGCSKTDGERCIESYMRLYDQAAPNAAADQRAVAKEAYTRRCTDPHFGQ